MVAMGAFRPSRCTAAVAARTSASRLRAASLRCSPRLGFLAIAMPLIEAVSAPRWGRVHLNGRNPPDGMTEVRRADPRPRRAHRRTSPPGSPGRATPVDRRGDSMPSQPTPVPPDDLSRKLTVARPDHDQSLPHVGLVGDTYTILVTGEDTAGKYTLIDMHVPPGGGPPPHRHDFEEMFTVLDGEVQVTFRGETLVARAGETINVPANAPHAFTNAGDTPSRLLCMCAPSGQEEFFTLVGQPVATRTEAPPPLDADAQAAFIAKAKALTPEYDTELLPPPGAE